VPNQANKIPLSLTAVWIVDKINERGWQVRQYNGSDCLLNQGHDVRDVLRATVKSTGIQLTLELCGFIGAMGVHHNLLIPYCGVDNSDTKSCYDMPPGKERLRFWWKETDPNSALLIGCFLELEKHLS